MKKLRSEPKAAGRPPLVLPKRRRKTVVDFDSLNLEGLGQGFREDAIMMEVGPKMHSNDSNDALGNFLFEPGRL